MEQVFPIVGAIVVLIIASLAIGAALRATRAVGRELRGHLEREGWGSIRPLFFSISGGFRGTWQGREALARYRAREKSHPPLLLIDVSTRQFERMRITRARTARWSWLTSLNFGLPPPVNLADTRFEAHARSPETIEPLVRDETTATRLDEFLRASEDRIDSKGGKLRLRRVLQDRKRPGFSFAFRPPAEEIEHAVTLAHRLLESLTTRGF